MQSVIREEEGLNGIDDVDEKGDDSGSDTTSVDGFTTTVADDRVQEGEPVSALAAFDAFSNHSNRSRVQRSSVSIFGRPTIPPTLLPVLRTFLHQLLLRALPFTLRQLEASASKKSGFVAQNCTMLFPTLLFNNLLN
jgi:hypothetical protein